MSDIMVRGTAILPTSRRVSRADMTRVLIRGANGQLARNTTRALLDDSGVTLTLYLRRAGFHV